MPFRAIVGHARLVSLMAQAVARDTLPPSLLFAGPAGVGKRLTAVALAEAINCLHPASSSAFERDACGTCASCQRITRGVHPDAFVIGPDDTGKIKIDRVRDVVAQAGYRPFEGRRRVVVFDDADAMVPGAQNALLKTLEEPPSASVFVLVSSLPDALLPTVRSRCPRLRFGPLTALEVATVLKRDHKYSEAEARAAAADADGSVGRALESESSDLTEARAAAYGLLEQMARSSDPAGRLAAAKALTNKKATPAAERNNLSVCLRVLASLLRDLGLLSSRGDPASLANADLLADLGRLAAFYDAERATRAFAAVDQALDALEPHRNANAKVVADWLVLQI